MLSANNDSTMNNNALADSMAISQAFSPENFGKYHSDWFETNFNGKEAQYLIDKTYANRELAYNTYMSNTAYSRAINDLKSAGVNPYLAISGLSQASTPATSTGNRGASTTKANGLGPIGDLARVFFSAFGFAKGLGEPPRRQLGFGHKY